MTKYITPEFQEAEMALEAAIDHFIAPEAKSDPEARSIMREWIIAHYQRGVIDIRDYVK